MAYYIDIIGYYSLFIAPDVVNGQFFEVNGMQNTKKWPSFQTATSSIAFNIKLSLLACHL